MRTLGFILIGALLGTNSPADAGEPPPSLTKFRCYICHSDHEPAVGPAFADVAMSYRGRANAREKIAHDIRAGMRSGGPWHMPPHPEVSVEEARAMARYILSLDARQPARRIGMP